MKKRKIFRMSDVTRIAVFGTRSEFDGVYNYKIEYLDTTCVSKKLTIYFTDSHGNPKINLITSYIFVDEESLKPIITKINKRIKEIANSEY